MTTFLTSNDTFALYRLPETADHFLIQQLDPKLTFFDGKSKGLQGFVVHPFFETDAANPAVLIRKEFFLKNPTVQFQSSQRGEVVSISKATYLKNVQRFIEATQKSGYTKLIFSRIKTLQNETHDLFELFLALKRAYPAAFVYLLNLPNIGCWMGASPEILIKKDAEESCQTVALAGTQRDLGLSLEGVRWGEKEIEEQAIVERCIVQTLENRGVAFRKTQPQTVKAGKVLHLKTQFQFQATDLYSLLQDLHPTPAVCGTPTALAKAFIQQNEPHQRAYYCGFVGTWNVQNQTDLFVNLRSMQVFRDKFALYVGGGITADSNAEREWEETELKAQTLADVIEQVSSDAEVIVNSKFR